MEDEGHEYKVMGFFRSMSAIRKAYKILAKLEQEINDYLRISKMESTDKTDLVNKRFTILNLIRELSDLERESGSTVQCAEFQFMGQQATLNQIIYLLYQIIR